MSPGPKWQIRPITGRLYDIELLRDEKTDEVTPTMRIVVWGTGEPPTIEEVLEADISRSRTLQNIMNRRFPPHSDERPELLGIMRDAEFQCGMRVRP